MATPPTSESLPRVRRIKKRWLIPLAVLGLVVVLVLFTYIRGTWADSTAKDPASSADGIITQLYQTPEGRKQVRAAVVLDYPANEVWAVLTDYPNHDKIFRYVQEVEASRAADGSHHLRSVVHSRIWGDWPYEVHVYHDQFPEEGRFIARWDEPSGPITVNRGRWVLQPAGDRKTRVVYTLEVEVRDHPTFLVRNLILDRIGKCVTDVAIAVKHGYPRP